jgi:glycerol dehydrogenase-like iron-containing ADH family enzyme
MYTQEQWQKWLEESPDKSLVDLLEGFYQGFGLADYLDQIGVIDDRIDKIVEELESIKAEAGSISTMVISPASGSRLIVPQGGRGGTG